jgi:hypothetical protein
MTPERINIKAVRNTWPAGNWMVPNTSMTAAQWLAEQRRLKRAGLDMQHAPLYDFVVCRQYENWGPKPTYVAIASRPTHRGAARRALSGELVMHVDEYGAQIQNYQNRIASR